MIRRKKRKQLKDNHRRKKPTSPERYPYTLTGLVYCAKCGEVMCGKSAHGRSGKVGYYEHSWSMRKNSTITEKVFSCEMHKRVPTKILEPMIDNLILKLLDDDDFLKDILRESQKVHEESFSANSVINALKKEVSSCNAQSEALAQRIAALPLEVPADALYKMLTTLGERKEKALTELQEVQTGQGAGIDNPIEIKDYRRFSEFLREFWTREKLSVEVKPKIIKLLIARIEIDSNEVVVHYFVGKGKIRKEVAANMLGPYPSDMTGNAKKIWENNGSRTCHNGAAGGT